MEVKNILIAIDSNISKLISIKRMITERRFTEVWNDCSNQERNYFRRLVECRDRDAVRSFIHERRPLYEKTFKELIDLAKKYHIYRYGYMGRVELIHSIQKEEKRLAQIDSNTEPTQSDDTSSCPSKD